MTKDEAYREWQNAERALTKASGKMRDLNNALLAIEQECVDARVRCDAAEAQYWHIARN